MAAFGIDEYVRLTGMLVRHLAKPHPRRYPVAVETLPDAERAVYIAVDAEDQVRYVGSVARCGAGALRQRINEHLQLRPSALTWTGVWVVELHPGTPRETVRWAESLIGEELSPTDNARLPISARVGRRIVHFG